MDEKIIPSNEYSGLLNNIALLNNVSPDSPIYKAFLECDRRDFVPDFCEKECYDDTPLPLIKTDYPIKMSTISQPSTVMFMLDLLAVKPGDRVLEIGFGSGWQTAILSKLAGENGIVNSTELLSEIFEFGKKNLRGYNALDNIHLFNTGDLDLSYWLGHDTSDFFERIIVAAGVQSDVPQALIDQLANGGVLIMPVGCKLLKITKSESGFLKGSVSVDNYNFVRLVI